MQEAISFLQSFFSGLNWVDWLIILISIFYMVEGYTSGAISGLFDIAGFLLSFGAGLKLYKPLGSIIGHILHVPQSVLHIIGFAVAAIFIEIILRFIEAKFVQQMRKAQWLVDSPLWQANKILGIIPGLISGLVLLAFLLTIMIVLPVAPGVKQTIGSSTIGNALVSKTQNFEHDLTSFFGGTQNDLLTFFTVEPQANGSLNLDFTDAQGTVDTSSEQQMLQMVNVERTKRNLPSLVMNDQLQKVAREHSQDMLTRGYFSHFTPEGKSPFDRMNDAGIVYGFAGENLAFSANVNLAMQGLMESPGHKANILSPNFRKVGIGVIDAGVYGKMFSQEFTD